MDLSKILDSLFLSDLESACNRDLIEEYKIKHIISILNSDTDILRIRSIHKDVNILHIDIADTEETNINRYFGHTYFFIERAIERGENVLVHCRGGISRSPTIIAAYLIRKYHMNVFSALAHIGYIRICIDPNLSFTRQLERCHRKMLIHSKKN